MKLKLTKKQESSILKAYNAYWDAYVHGDWRKTATFLEQNIYLVGTSEQEVYHNKKQVTQFFRDTVKEVKGNIQLRNRKQVVVPVDSTVLVNEELDLFIKAGTEWSFYSKVRLTSVMKEDTKGWKFLQQHGSVPDLRTQQGETIAFDKISKQNIQLRDAVNRRTVELQQKNRELAVESALERVRTVAMAMKKPEDMLDICRVISRELEGLGLREIRNVQTVIIDQPKAIYLNYEYYTLHKKNFITPIAYKENKTINRFVQQILKDTEGFYTSSKKGTELMEWLKFQAQSGQFVDPHLRKAKSLHYYFYSIGPGALGISTYAPLTNDDIICFKRFRNVFQLSYQRFIDIQIAETQAREAMIEASLERMRARAMSMRKPDELLDAADHLHKELSHLGIDSMNVSYALVDLEKKSDSYYSANPIDGSIIPFPFIFPHNETGTMRSILASWQKQELLNVLELNEKATIKHQTYIGKHIKQQFAKSDIPFSIDEFLSKSPKKAVLSTFNFSKGYLFHIGGARLTKIQEDIMLRATKVFDQTYTRFLDLRKAEAQAKESQIQLALERVRARTMAMHKSDELSEVVALLYNQFKELDFGLYQILISIINTEKNRIEWWSRGFQDAESPRCYFIPFVDHPFPNMQMQKWRSGETFHAHILEGEIKKSWEKHLFTKTDLKHFPKEIKKQMQSLERVYLSDAFMKYGVLQAAGPSPLSPDKNDILIRFAKVLDQAYTRMRDLQKAEAQARESKIEAALEKVRGRAMAMQKSDELQALIGTVSTELTKLEIVLERCFIAIFDPVTRGSTWWMASGETNGGLVGLFMKYHESPPYLAYLEAWDKRIVKWQYVLEGEIKKKWDKYIFKETEFSLLPEIVITNMKGHEKVILNASFNTFGCITLATLDPLTEEQSDILIRMAKVFDLTYTRFNDLKLAEAQAREATIQLALERVQSRAMAMQKSDELAEAAQILYRELKKLNLKPFTCGYMFIDETNNKQVGWFVLPDGTMLPDFIDFPLTGDEVLDARYHDWKARKPLHIYELKGEANRAHHEFLSPFVPDFIVKNIFSKVPDPLVFHCANFSDGYVLLLAEERFSEDEQQTVIRFAKAFEVTYTRFLDLQKAEANAREAQIEASLERVRSKAMAMHSSEELATAISTFYHEIEMLTVTPIRCGVALVDKDSKIAELSTMNTTEAGESFVVMGHIKMEGHRILEEVFDHWLQQKEYHATLRGSEINEYYKVLRPQIDFPEYPHDEVQYGYYFMFNEGDVYAWTEKPLTEEQLKIYRRFTTVLSLTFKRYKDLKYAEAQAREANIEVALERVRAKALAMQNPEELQDVAQVLRNEMGALGIEELETASIYIQEKDSSSAECWYALKDPVDASRKMVADQFHINLDDTWVGREMNKFYLSGERQTSIVMKGDNRKEWIDYCYKHSPVFSGYYGATIPDRTYHLYKFSHGYIGAAAPGDISPESWRLLSRAASVFSLAYSRFKDLTQARSDLQRLKEEKQRAESALSELKSTQTQLIQAEKMASLGELTAGIAHEIQNPLNFVNNFSELSNELIEEMKDELLKERKEEAIQLLENVRQNLDKINFHGKRADAIVKNMLQHSRSSSGQKEFTDINSLADEYLRLAYHGFRAKDKSFNSKFETQLDEKLEKIKVVPQEMGRVILNLINNAFYAVSEKKKKNLAGYEPLVKVTTLQTNGITEISIRDNGIGIPKQMLNKIFQPFFTTKPTGQGTGLGLSLSYDIITKGHGGELKVKTEEGEGTEFVIQLPNSGSHG